MPYKDLEKKRAYARRASKLYRERHPERALLNAKRWRESHPEEVRKSVSGWNKRHPDYQKNYWCLRMYGITLEERRALQNRFNGLCWICLKRSATDVDHIAATRIVRGMLCGNCNRGIGMMDHDTETLKRAVRYLRVKS